MKHLCLIEQIGDILFLNEVDYDTVNYLRHNPEARRIAKIHRDREFRKNLPHISFSTTHGTFIDNDPRVDVRLNQLNNGNIQFVTDTPSPVARDVELPNGHITSFGRKLSPENLERRRGRRIHKTHILDPSIKLNAQDARIAITDPDIELLTPDEKIAFDKEIGKRLGKDYGQFKALKTAINFEHEKALEDNKTIDAERKQKEAIDRRRANIKNPLISKFIKK